MISSRCGKPIAATSSRPATSTPRWRPWSPTPYVNHVPTMTGGVGHDQLKRFYKYHFIGAQPARHRAHPDQPHRRRRPHRRRDAVLLHPHQRDRLDAAGRRADRQERSRSRWSPSCSFGGDKVAHEHIYWDQASVLVQIGLLDPAGLPVAGVRDRAQGRRQRPAQQRADARLAAQRGQAGLIFNCRTRGAGRWYLSIDRCKIFPCRFHTGREPSTGACAACRYPRRSYIV